MSFRLLVCGFLLSPALALAQNDQLPKRMDKMIENSSIPGSNLGIVIYDLTKVPQVLLYGHNEQLEYIPASVTKLATAATVLIKLGPSFKTQTSLMSNGTVKDGVLEGDLWLKGGGDAGFVSESMWNLVNEFTRAGITKIDGSLVVDDTDFDAIRADPSRDPERNDRAYDAPVGAMSFNWNSINIYVRPTAVGQPPQVTLDPIDNGYRIVNRAKTHGKGGWAIQVERSGKTITVNGSIGMDHAEQAVYKNVDDPVEWSGRALRFFLAQRGITATGGMRPGKVHPAARVLAKIDSQPISQHVADMMKFSNNYVAEMLTKDLALAANQKPASLDAGMQIIRNEVTQMGLDPQHFTLLNPSGLNRKNRIRPTDLAQILVTAQRSFPWFAEFLTALPLAGLDGTLKKRMKDSPAQGWVRAKTGQLSGVAALAGYAGRKDGTMRVFAFIFNGKNELSETARHLFDQLATELVQ